MFFKYNSSITVSILGIKQRLRGHRDAENYVYFRERQETVVERSREAGLLGGGAVQFGFTCHAPEQHRLHKTNRLPALKEKKTKAED